MIGGQHGGSDGITKAFRSTKRSRRIVKIESSVKREHRSRSHSPAPAQFAEAFVDSFRYAGPSTRSTSQSSPAVKKEALDEDEKLKPEEEVLNGVPDYVREDMDLLVIGSNPGRMSSHKAQHFAHPSNHFYRTLHGSGLTPVRVPPSLDYTMLDQPSPFFSIGLTNLAARPTRMAHELGKSENAEGATILLALIRRYKPRVGVFIGLGVARAFEQSVGRVGDPVKDRNEQISLTVPIPVEVPETSDKDMGSGVGLMAIAVRHDQSNLYTEATPPAYTLLFAVPSTSGRVTSHQLPQKTECMRRLRILLEEGNGTTKCKDVAIRLI